MKYVTPSARTYKYEAFLAVNCDTILHVVQMEDLKKMVSSTYLILDNGTCTMYIQQGSMQLQPKHTHVQPN